MNRVRNKYTPDELGALNALIKSWRRQQSGSTGLGLFNCNTLPSTELAVDQRQEPHLFFISSSILQHQAAGENALYSGFAFKPRSVVGSIIRDCGEERVA